MDGVIGLGKLQVVMEGGRNVFQVDTLERRASKGHGTITCLAAGNDVIVLGTSKGWVIRHDFGAGDFVGNFFPLPPFIGGFCV